MTATSGATIQAPKISIDVMAIFKGLAEGFIKAIPPLPWWFEYVAFFVLFLIITYIVSFFWFNFYRGG